MAMYTKGLFFTAPFTVTCIVAIFRHPSFDVLIEMSQSQPMQIGVCYGNEPLVQPVMLVGCDRWISIRLVCFSISKDRCEEIIAMHVTLKVDVNLATRFSFCTDMS